MGIFTKKAKITLYNEGQKDEMIEKLEEKDIEYRLKIRQNEMNSEQVIYELIIAESDLKKVS